MTDIHLYRGVWPQNVSKVAKYAVRFVDGDWRVTVQYEAGDGLRYLAVEGGDNGLAGRVNSIKEALFNPPGGAFYINEYRHVVVPVKGDDGGSVYFQAGMLHDDLTFEYEGEPLRTRPTRPNGTALEPGDEWIGPRPGIPYVLKAGAADVEFRSPALTDDDPPALRPNTERRVRLSRVLQDPAAVKRAVAPIARIRGHAGGRFYVNEHLACFSPVDRGDGDGLRYVYCGQVDLADWFPEP